MFDFITTFNGGFLVGLTIVVIVMLIITHPQEYGAIAAHRLSVRARLPFGSDEVAFSVRRRARALVRGNVWGLLVVDAISFLIFVTTPLSSSPQFLLILTLMIFLGVLTASSLVVSLRERLFAPAPTAVRIARVQPMNVRDYLGPWRRRTPDALLAMMVFAVVGLAVMHLNGGVDSSLSALTYVVVVVGVVLFVGTRILERTILAQPQPATNTLELAWDDLFRADTLSMLRMTAACAMWLGFGMALTLLWTMWLLPSPDSRTIAELFPWWGVPVVQLLYMTAQGKLPAPLYPTFLTAPTLAPTAGTTSVTGPQHV